MRILVATDDRDTAEFVRRGLELRRHEVVTLNNGTEALRLAEAASWDAIVLDLELRDLDGLSVLRRLRARKVATPLLLLTALGRMEDRVEGLAAGADDHLHMPFLFSELDARLNILLRSTTIAADVRRLEWGPLSLDLRKRTLQVSGTIVHLQPHEFRILEELVRNGDMVVTRAMLLERVWGFYFQPQTNIVATHISRLRAKLADHGLKDVIETFQTVGYRLRLLS